MPSYGLLVVSSLGIMGCGVAAGTYQAKHNTEGTEDWRKLPPSQQVKHWKLYVFLEGKEEMGRRHTLFVVHALFNLPSPTCLTLPPPSSPPSLPPLFHNRDPNSHFNPTRFAAKALAVGTVLCLSATGATAFVLGRAFNVNSVDEFISKMRVWAPAKKKELEVWLHIKPNVALEVEKRRVEKMTYDEEMDYWGDIVMKEEREKEARAAAAGAAGGVVTAGAEVVGTGGGKQQQQQQQQQQWWWPWRAKA